MRRVVTLAPGRMEVREGLPPVVRAGEALIEIRRVGLCGSDYSLFRGSHPYSTFPQTQGHECSGVVRELPSAYDGAARVGDLVAIEPLLPCGTCALCRAGRYNCCPDLKVLGAHVPGALAEQVAVPVERLYPAGALDPDLAALVEPVSIALQSLQRGGVRAGDTVLVLGGGTIGLATTLAATDAGARVLLSDRLPARLERGRAAGARLTIPSEPDLVRRAIVATDGRGPDVVVDATGAPTMIRAAVDAVGHGGTVVVVGISTAEVSLPVAELTRKEITLRGSRNNAGRFPEAIALVGRHAEVVRSWISHRVTLDDAPAALALALERPDLVGKVMVEVSG